MEFLTLEAIKRDAETQDSFARMMDHLKANEVNTDVTQTVVGPLLKIDHATEMFTGGEKVITDTRTRIRISLESCVSVSHVSP